MIKYQIIMPLYLVFFGSLIFFGCSGPKGKNEKNPETEEDADNRGKNESIKALDDDWAEDLSSSELIAFQKKQHADDDEILDAIAMLEDSSAFEDLEEKTKIKLVLLVSGRNEAVSVPARQQLRKIADKLDESKALLTILEPINQIFPLTKKSIADFELEDEPEPAPVWPRSTGWKETEGLKYAITMDYPDEPSIKKTFVYHDVADQTDWIDPESAADCYANIPFELAKIIPGVRISQFSDVSGSAGSDGVIDMRATNVGGFHTTFVHEAGHSAWNLKGRKNFTNEDWESAVEADGVYPSQYAKSKTGEHIAEVAVVYAEAQRSPHRHEYYAIFYEQLKLFEKSIIE